MATKLLAHHHGQHHPECRQDDHHGPDPVDRKVQEKGEDQLNSRGQSSRLAIHEDVEEQFGSLLDFYGNRQKEQFPARHVDRGGEAAVDSPQ